MPACRPVYVARMWRELPGARGNATSEQGSSATVVARRATGRDPDIFTWQRTWNPQHGLVMENLNTIWDQAHHWWQTVPVGQKAGMALVGLVILLASGVGTRSEKGR